MSVNTIKILSCTISAILMLIFTGCSANTLDMSAQSVASTSEPIASSTPQPSFEPTPEPTPTEKPDKLSLDEVWDELIKNEFPNAEGSTFYSDRGNPKIVIISGTTKWNEVDRPFKKILFYNGEQEDAYKFGVHLIYYEADGETVYLVRSVGWYFINYYTGEYNKMGAV